MIATHVAVTLALLTATTAEPTPEPSANASAEAAEVKVESSNSCLHTDPNKPPPACGHHTVPQKNWYSKALATAERGVNVLTARTTRPWEVLTLITHRTNQSFTDAPFREALGFDSGNLKIGLGLRMGLMEGLDFGVYRLNGTLERFDTYQWDVRYQFLRQETFHVDAAVRAGVTWFEQPGKDAAGYLGQVIVSRILWNRLVLGGGLSFHSDTSGPQKTSLDDDHTFGAFGLVEARLDQYWALSYEISGGFAGYKAKYPAMSLAAKLITPRHTFSIVVSNTQYMTDDGLLPGTDRKFKDLILGFNITREIELPGENPLPFW